jgi:hypothetical protein
LALKEHKEIQALKGTKVIAAYKVWKALKAGRALKESAAIAAYKVSWARKAILAIGDFKVSRASPVGLVKIV